MTKILFVCHGNICRSPMAEFVMKHMVRQAGLEKDYEISSAAATCEELGNDMYPPAKRKLTREGIPFTRREAQLMTRADYRRYDHIIGMDRDNLARIQRICGGDPDGKMSMLLDWSEGKRKGCNVADPWFTGDFDITYDDITEGCSGLLKSLESSKTRLHWKNSKDVRSEDS